jgi:hypothetical protein
MSRQYWVGYLLTTLLAPALFESSYADRAERSQLQAAPEQSQLQPTPRYSAPEFLKQSDWPVVFDLSTFGIQHLQTAVVTELTTGHRQYQTIFLSRSLNGAPVCCLAQLWVEEGTWVGAIANLPLTRIAESDIGTVVKPRREDNPGRIAEPALRYLPLSGSFGGDSWGCFVFLSDVVTVLRNRAQTALVYHGYFCQRGAALPTELTVTAVMQNLKLAGA